MLSYYGFFIFWYVIITIIGWLSIPLVNSIFIHLPDRGFAFTKPFGLLITGYLFWLLSSLGFLRIDSGGILLAIILMTVAGYLLTGRSGIRELLVWLSEQRKYILVSEILFFSAFMGWTIVRAYNPDIYGTEKPMEFMFLNSILRSPTLPPHDAWLSGHAISYYYFGYLLIALISRLSNTPSSIAFNLGLALFFALTAISAFGFIVNLVALTKPGQSNAKTRPENTLIKLCWPGLLGPLFVLLVGNFYGTLELAHKVLPADIKIPMVWYDFGVIPDQSTVRSLGEFTQPPGIKTGLVNIWEWLDLKQLNDPSHMASVAPFDFANWFFAARVIHDRNLIGIETEAIDENPAFSFLLGDLHPHVLALPFVLLSIVLAFDWLLWSHKADAIILTKIINDKRLIFRLLITGIILGSLAFLNAWDFPIYWFLIMLAILFGFGSNLGWDFVSRNKHYLGLFAVILFVTSVTLYFPFYITFQSQASGVLPNLIYPTRFQQTIVMFGPLLIVVTIFLIWSFLRWKSVFDYRVALWVGVGVVVLLSLFCSILGLILGMQNASFLDLYIYPLSRKDAISLLLQRRLIDSMAVLFPAVVIGIVTGLCVGTFRRAGSIKLVSGYGIPRTEDELSNTRKVQFLNKPIPETSSPAVLMIMAIILTGALLLIFPEFLYLRDNFGTRMNTIFKFYFQVWVLWGLASAYGLWYLHQLIRKRLRWMISGLIITTIFPGLLYTFGTLYTKTDHFAGPVTLDGISYFARNYPDDAAAIEWFNKYVSPNWTGKPVILEGTRGAYWIEGPSSRISMGTGLPTVLGWANHEQQWRGSYYSHVAGREGDIQTLYQTRDWETTQALLDKYEIEYVVVGSFERSVYQVYSSKFERNMQPVFQSGDLTIYQRISGP